MSVKFGFVAQNVIDEGRTTWKDIKEIQKWLETRHDLPKYTNEQIVCFLLACDNEEEATKSTIVAFHVLRNQIPEFFSNRNLNDPNLKKIIKVINFNIFPKRTDDGCVIIYIKLTDTNYLNFEYAENMKMIYMILDSTIYDNPPNGFILIADMEGMGFMHLTRLKIGLMRKGAQYLQTGLPVKLKNIHLINAPYFTGKLFGIIKPMVYDHVFNKMICHTRAEMKTFCDNYISKQFLPLELGGELPTIDVINKETLQKLRRIQSHFDAEEKQREEYKI